MRAPRKHPACRVETMFAAKLADAGVLVSSSEIAWRAVAADVDQSTSMPSAWARASSSSPRSRGGAVGVAPGERAAAVGGARARCRRGRGSGATSTGVSAHRGTCPFEQAVEAVLDAEHLEAGGVGPQDDGADHRVEAGAVAAPGRDAPACAEVVVICVLPGQAARGLRGGVDGGEPAGGDPHRVGGGAEAQVVGGDGEADGGGSCGTSRGRGRPGARSRSCTVASADRPAPSAVGTTRRKAPPAHAVATASSVTGRSAGQPDLLVVAERRRGRGRPGRRSVGRRSARILLPSIMSLRSSAERSRCRRSCRCAGPCCLRTPRARRRHPGGCARRSRPGRRAGTGRGRRCRPR